MNRCRLCIIVTAAIVVVLFIISVVLGILLYRKILSQHDNSSTYERITLHNYTAVEHYVTTEDGYILQMVRLPNENGIPVLLLNGLSASADTWITAKPENILPYQLYDNGGYDVWLVNPRGNRYSRNHTNKSLDSADFWQFSFHEIGTFDLAASIDYILAVTEFENLHYIGYSQGGTSLLALIADRPIYQKKLRSINLLAPAVFLTHARSALLKISSWVLPNTLMGEKLKNFETFQHNAVLSWMCHHISSRETTLYPLFKMTISLIVGDLDVHQTVQTNLCKTHPAGISTNSAFHYAQIFASRKFRKYDHGAALNIEYYGRLDPPSYNLSQIDKCLNIYYGDSDVFVEEIDLLELGKKLKCTNMYKVPIRNWNHVDFMWGPNVSTLVFNRILKECQQYDSKINT